MAIVMHAESPIRATFRRSHAVVVDDPSTYREFVFRCALAVCGEPDGAEDVAQEVLLILLKARNRLGHLENPDAWVRKVTVRLATRYLKQQGSKTVLPESLRDVEGPEDRVAVYLVLRRLSPEQRAILGMALNQGLSYREIGEALGVPEGTVASRLSTAKQEFRKRWEG